MKRKLATKNPLTLLRSDDKANPSWSNTVKKFLSKIWGEDNFETILTVRVLQVLSGTPEYKDQNSGKDIGEIINALMYRFGCANYTGEDIRMSVSILDSFSLILWNQERCLLSNYGKEATEAINELSTTYPEFRTFTKRENESLSEHFELIQGGAFVGRRLRHLLLVFTS